MQKWLWRLVRIRILFWIARIEHNIANRWSQKYAQFCAHNDFVCFLFFNSMYLNRQSNDLAVSTNKSCVWLTYFELMYERRLADMRLIKSEWRKEAKKNTDHVHCLIGLKWHKWCIGSKLLSALHRIHHMNLI